MLSSVSTRITSYCEGSDTRFWLVATLERMVATTFVAVIAGSVFHMPGRTDLGSLSDVSLIILLVLVAPLLETLLFQLVPCMIARDLGCSQTTQLLWGWIPFAIAHFPAGASAFLCAGVVSGLYLAYIFVRISSTSLARAYWFTCASHAVLNAIVALTIVSRHR